jgi:hypothetical protein
MTSEKNYKQAVLPVGAPGRSPERSQVVPSVAEEIFQEKPLVGSPYSTRYKANWYYGAE